MSARSAECRCDASFTCGYCLRNAPPYFFTPSTNAEAMARAIAAPIEPHEFRIPEYDDGYGSAADFERAGADQPEDCEED